MKNNEVSFLGKSVVTFCAHFFLVADTLRENFEQYGEVTECNIMKDPISKRSRYGTNGAR